VKLILGVDAGGTTTDAIVCTPDGAVIGAGSAGCGSWEEVGLEAAVAAVLAATTAAGTTPERVHAAGLALAGVDWPGDEKVLSDALRAAGMPRRHVVVNDAFAALRAGSPDGVGVVSCAGTGCITAARSPDGRVFRTLAVGYGEWGGSWELAREGVHAVARARHGTGPPTALTERIPQALGLPDADALFRAIAREDYHPEPSLARVVLGAAGDGDSVAILIAAAGGDGLARSAAAAAARLELEPPVLVVRSGGVHRAGCTALDDAFAAGVADLMPGCEVRLLAASPATGAALLALDQLGRVAPSVHHRLLEEAVR